MAGGGVAAPPNGDGCAILALLGAVPKGEEEDKVLEPNVEFGVVLEGPKGDWIFTLLVAGGPKGDAGGLPKVEDAPNPPPELLENGEAAGAMLPNVEAGAGAAPLDENGEGAGAVLPKVDPNPDVVPTGVF